MEIPDPIALKFDRILFATDFSPAALRSLPYAAAIAQRFAATLFVAHVIPPEVYRSVPAEKRDAHLIDMRREAQERIHAMMAAAHLQGIRSQVLVVHGDVLPNLVSIAEEHDIDLMVATTRGRHGLHKLVSGSLAEAIYRETVRPVLLVGPEVIGAPGSGLDIERILCIPNLARQSQGGALRYAFALAAVYSAKLYFLHLVDNPWTEPQSTRMSHQDFFRMRLLEKGFPEKEDGIEPELLVEFGSPETQALARARKQRIQVIVMSAQSAGPAGLSTHLPGSLAYNIISHSECPVVMVHDSWGAETDRKPTGLKF